MKLKLVGLLAVISPLLLISCESTSSRRAGGGAFDDSELGRTLDGNGIVPDPESPKNQSFEDWRNLD